MINALKRLEGFQSYGGMKCMQAMGQSIDTTLAGTKLNFPWSFLSLRIDNPFVIQSSLDGSHFNSDVYRCKPLKGIALHSTNSHRATGTLGNKQDLFMKIIIPTQWFATKI